MTPQNFKNHTRLVPGFHGVTNLLILSLFVGSIVSFFQADTRMDKLLSVLLLIAACAMMGLSWYARTFALKAQDRAIRSEENFRHFILTGKPLDKNLRLGQIIALRFASDEEMPSLAAKAVEEKMSARAIKMAIQNWKGDYHRV